MTPNITVDAPRRFLKILTSRMQDCLEEGKVAVFDERLRCYSVNSQANCGHGSQLVADLEYPFTRCMEHVDSEGELCPPNHVAYMGKCRHQFDSCGQCKKSLDVDAFGQVGCACPADLGFLEWWDGSCYQEFSPGPCPDGQRLLQGVHGPECQAHNCSDGKLSITTYTFNHSFRTYPLAFN